MQTPTPGLPAFDYIQPASLTAASRFLAGHAGQARPFMGGTDTFVRMRDGVWREKFVVDVKNLDGMHEISFNPAGGLTLGAAISMNRVIAVPEVQQHYPILVEAIQTVASYQLRSRATIVGNLCNASPAADTSGACLVLNGSLRVHGVEGEREEPLRTFFRGPGQTVLRPGDIVTALLLPPPPPHYAARYIKLARNVQGDLAIVGITALGYADPKTPSGYRFRLALASVAPTPLAPVQAEAILAEQPLTAATITAAAEAAMAACSPIDDVRASARYRKFMVRNLTQQAVTEVWEQLNGDS